MKINLEQKNDCSKTVAALRSLIINLLLKNRPINLAAQIDDFADDFDALLIWLRELRFL